MSFLKNAKVMLIGFALAQAVPLLASPFLTRLFSPEAFGLQSLFISLTSILAVAATLRLDLATVIADNRREAIDIVSLGLIQMFAVTLVVSVIVILFSSQISAVLGYGGHSNWLWACPLMLIALGTVQLSSGTMTWFKRFGPVSQAQVLNQLCYVAVAVGIGLYGAPLEGFIWAKLVGQGLAALVLALLLAGILREVRLPPLSVRSKLWTKCKPFLFFNTPYSMIGLVGREVPILAFSAVAATSAAGFYGLARSMLGAPATLLAASLSQVFYREAAEHRGTQRLQELTVALLTALITVSAPVFALLLVWGDYSFAWAFGKEWETAGEYAMALAIPAWLAVQTAWPERLFESVGRQGVSFRIQIAFDVTAALVVFALVLAGQAPSTVVMVFAVINSLFHLCYLTGMFYVAGFQFIRLGRLLLIGGAAFILSSLAFMMIRFLATDAITGMFVAVSLAFVLSTVLLYRGYKPVASHLTV